MKITHYDRVSCKNCNKKLYEVDSFYLKNAVDLSGFVAWKVANDSDNIKKIRVNSKNSSH